MNGQLRIIELYEDNSGGLWFVPNWDDIMVEMPQDGDFVTDCETFEYSWVPERDCPESTHPLNRRDIARMTLIATYGHIIHEDQADLRIETDATGRFYAGAAGRNYLRASLGDGQ